MLRFLFLLSLFGGIYSYSVEVPTKERTCVSVVAKAGEKCTGSFEVLSPNPRTVAVTVHGPPPKMVLFFESRYDGLGNVERSYSEGSFSIDIELSGEYRFCVENNDDIQTKLVAFNFRTVSALSNIHDYKYFGLQTELSELTQGLEMLKDHQGYMNQREDVHTETLENINRMVVFWTVLESIFLGAIAYWQVRYISTFFETRRRL